MLPPDFMANALRAAFPPEHTYKVALYKDLFEGTHYTPDGEEDGYGYTAKVLNGYRIDGATLHFDRTVEWLNVDIASRSAVVFDADSGLIMSITDFGRRCGVLNGLFTVTLSEKGVVSFEGIEE